MCNAGDRQCKVNPKSSLQQSGRRRSESTPDLWVQAEVSPAVPVEAAELNNYPYNSLGFLYNYSIPKTLF